MADLRIESKQIVPMHILQLRHFFSHFPDRLAQKIKLCHHVLVSRFVRIFVLLGLGDRGCLLGHLFLQ